MSDEKPGIFVNKKTTRPTKDAAPVGVAAPKNVKKRWMYVGFGVLGLVVLSSSIFGDRQPIQVQKKQQAPAMINTNPRNADSEAFSARYAKELESVKVEQERVRAELAAKDKRIEELQKAAKNPVAAAPTSGLPSPLPAGIVAPPVMGNTGGLATISAPPLPPTPISRTAPTGGSLGHAAAPAGMEAIPQLAPVVRQVAEPMEFVAPAIDRASSKAANTEDGIKVKTTYQKNPNAGLIPAGAFAPVALLNGVDAGTSSTTQSNPMPVLMRVTDQAILPGSARYKLKSCFVLATAYGDLSAERVYARISRLSCVDAKDRVILSQEVQGYLVDSDGKLGLRGMVTDRQGAKLGKAMLAGFAQGLASALGSAQSTVLSNATTGTTTSSIGGADAIRAAGLQGGQTAAAQLAQFYLKEAQAIFPVITVDAGRTGTIVFTGSTTLNWASSDSAFTTQVSPQQ